MFLLIGILRLPESPRWLVYRNYINPARRVLRWVRAQRTGRRPRGAGHPRRRAPGKRCRGGAVAGPRGEVTASGADSGNHGGDLHPADLR
ncbi:MFS transporter [Streptomyces halstedii]|uniref:MFS transporter n=1 Tax=Streptomyces halstedii TaxID=1944 RepID=UPI003461012A